MPTANKAVAKVSLSFGLVNLPVRVIKATEASAQSFHQVHQEDGGRIKQRRFCSIDDEEVPYADIAKGLETADGTVIITPEDMEGLPLATTKEIAVTQFVSVGEITPTMHDASYYLEPDGPGSARAYALLHAALADSGRVAIAKVSLRQGRERLAMVRVEGQLMMLTTLLWPEEVRTVQVDGLDDVEIAGPTLKMAKELVDSMTAPFNPDDYKDEYGRALQEVVDAKLAGKTLVAAAPKEAAPKADLADLLAASLAAGKKKAKKAS